MIAALAAVGPWVDEQAVADGAATVHDVAQVGLRWAIVPDRPLRRVTPGTRMPGVGAMPLG